MGRRVRTPAPAPPEPDHPDLLVVAADRQWVAVLEEIFGATPRLAALGVRALDAEVTNVPARTDGWLRRSGPAFSRTLVGSAERFLLVLDHEGCDDPRPAEIVESDVESQLAGTWGDRAAALVVAPELEEWLVGASSSFRHLDGLGGVNALDWWRACGLWPDGA
ncbi:MAG: hypothetical protein ABMB14_34305, partial [Myxococcota bacterium]